MPHLPTECWLFLFFVAGNLFVTSYKPYILLLVGYASILYIVTRNATNAVWYTLLGSLLFFKAKYFTIPYISQFAASHGLQRDTPFVYSVAFWEILLAIIVYLLIRNRHQLNIKRPIFIEFVLLIILLIIGTLSSLQSSYGDVSWFSLWKMFEYFVLFFASVFLLSDIKVLRTTLVTLLLFVSFNSSLILLQYLSGGPIGIALEDVSTGLFGRFADELPGLYRPGGMYFEPNLSASLINIMLPISFYLSFGNRIVRNQNITRIVFAVLLMALIFTGSRTNWIIALLSLTVSYIYLKREVVLKKFSLHKYTIALIIVALFFVMPVMIKRASTIGQALTDERGGWAFRLRHLTITKEFMWERLWGVGVDGFQYQILDSYKPDYYFSHFTAPHNMLAEIGSGFGIIGLGVFLLFVLSIYKRSWKLIKLKIGSSGLIMTLLIGYTTYLLSAQFYPWLFAPPLSEISWIILGGLYARLQNKSH